MKNKSKIFKTIQCAEIFEFDELMLKHEYIGWKKIDESYSNYWNNIHSQILGNIQNQKREGK